MRRLALGILLTVMTVAWADPTPRIEVRERSTVQGAQFTLGEVATISGADAPTAERLRAVVLGSSPLPGLERPLTREQILIRLRQHGFQPEAFTLVTPARMVICREKKTLQGQQLVEAVVATLRNALNLPDDAQVECPTPPHDVSLPQGEVRLTAGEPRVLGGGWYSVPLYVSTGRGALATLNVRLRVGFWREVVVTQRSLRPGEVVDDTAVATGRFLVYDEGGDFLTTAEEACGKVVRQTIPARQPLRRSALEEPALIRRGQQVKLLVQMDGAVIEASALALQDGKAGARIRVQVVDTRKTLTATVVDSQTVQMCVP